jgi:hypothetical protein
VNRTRGLFGLSSESASPSGGADQPAGLAAGVDEAGLDVDEPDEDPDDEDDESDEDEDPDEEPEPDEDESDDEVDVDDDAESFWAGATAEDAFSERESVR